MDQKFIYTKDTIMLQLDFIIICASCWAFGRTREGHNRFVSKMTILILLNALGGYIFYHLPYKEKD